MKFKKLFFIFWFFCGLMASICADSNAEDLKIILMQDKPGDAKKYAPLKKYLQEKSLKVSFIGAKNYPMAAKLFAEGKGDAMFSGSGVAGIMIMKELAEPLVRPLSPNNISTYKALIIVPQGMDKFTGEADYFKNKKVIFCSLASSGEFFFRSIKGSLKVNAKTLKASSHGSAIDALSKGMADVAVIKNLVWNNIKGKYPKLMVGGADPGENPNGTFIVSKKVNADTKEKLKKILLTINQDKSPTARKVLASLKCSKFIATTQKDFEHTLGLLAKAGVTKDFNFKF